MELTHPLILENSFVFLVLWQFLLVVFLRLLFFPVRLFELQTLVRLMRFVNFALDHLALDDLAIDRFALDDLAIDRFALDDLAIDRFALDRFALDHFALDHFALDHFALDDFLFF